MISCGIYVRASLDRDGTGLAVDRQESECRDKAERLGWAVHDVYVDNSMSASTGRRRPAFERLLDDLGAGTVDAVVAWHPDRLARRPDDLERLVAAVEKRGAKVATVQAGDIDLSTATGQAVARTVVAWARQEVQHKGQRQRAANRQAAAAGRYPAGGRRHFGYTAKGEIEPREANVIRELAASLLAGTSVHELSRRLNSAGFETTAGGAWRPTETRRMLASPRLAAQRVYCGEVVGIGAWKAVLPLETHLAVRAELARPERHKAGPPRRHLLSGVARCGVCDAPMQGVADLRRGAPAYRCPTRRHVHRRAAEVEAMVDEVVIARLSRADAASLFQRADRADVGRIRAELAQVRARLDALAVLLASGDIDSQQLAAGTAEIRSREAALEASLLAAVASPAAAALISSENVASSWLKLPISNKRAVLRELLSIRLQSPGRGARVFDPATVEIHWKPQ